MEAPDTDKLLARAEDDIACGEAWRARQRLRTWTSQFKEEPRFAARLGEMLLEIGELPDAQRMLCRGCSPKEEHQAILAEYLASKEKNGEFRSAIRRALLHAGAGVQLPRAVTEAIEARGLKVDGEVARAMKEKQAKRKERRKETLLFRLAMTAIAALFVLVLVLGSVSLIRIVTGWFS